MKQDGACGGRWEETLALVEVSLERAAAALGSLTLKGVEEAIPHWERAAGLLRSLEPTEGEQVSSGLRRRLAALRAHWAAESELLGRVLEFRLGALAPVPVESHYTARGTAAGLAAKGRIAMEG